MDIRSNSNSSTYQHVLQETHDKMQELEKAIEKINSSMKFLKHNTAEVKSSISSVFRYHSEALRNRECELLSQIDAVQQEKEGNLRVQKDRLCSLLGGLQASLSYSKEDNKELYVLAKHLSMSLERLDKLDLRPQETPHFGFHADIKSFQNSIQSFGSVTAVTPVLNSAFVSPLSNSSCMPRTFEDYGDMEHLVLYKTLEDVSTEDQINVHIPKLCGGSPLGLDLTPSSATRFVFPSPSASELFNVTSNHCLDHWLAQIKNDTEIEEDCDFEVLSYGQSPTESSFSFEKVPVYNQSHNGISFPLFKQTLMSSNQNWLVKSSNNKDLCPSSEEQNYNNILIEMENMKAFDSNRHDPKFIKEIPKIEEKYRIKDQPISSKECSLSTSCGGNQFERYDIENLDSLFCLNADKVKNDWLSPMKDSGKIVDASNKLEKDIDEMELDSVSTCCQANEVCSSFSECLMDDNCCSNNKSYSINTPLMVDSLPPSRDPAYLVDVMKHFYDIQNSGKLAWLKPKFSEDHESEKCDKDSDTDSWLSSPKRKKFDDKFIVKNEAFLENIFNSDQKWLVSDNTEISELKLASQIIEKNKDELKWLLRKENISSKPDKDSIDKAAILKNPLFKEWLQCY